jgi:nicotinamidase-related amidase
MRIEKEKSIGLIIDMQEKLYPIMDKKSKLLENCIKLISGLQELSIPILATQQYSKGLGITLTEISSLFSDFSFIEKTTFSCYDEPDFVKKLEEKEIKNVIICGIESHVCVLQTAIDIKTAGYVPVVVFDCISSRSDKNKQIALDRFRNEGIIISSYESILFELARSSSSSAFKAISKIVK